MFAQSLKVTSKSLLSSILFLLLQIAATGSVLAAQSSANASRQNLVVATIKGEPISLQQISRGNELEIYQAEKTLFDLRMRNLKALLIGRLIKLDSRSNGLSENEFIARFIAKPTPVTDAMVDVFIAQRKIAEDKINTNLKEQVRSFLLKQQIAQQVDQWFIAQSQKHDVQVALSEPPEPRFTVNIDGAAYKGGENAKVTIVEFSDFECPYCARAVPTLKQLASIYGDKIKLVYKHFPLPNHPEAPKAAEATICAQDQGMDYFWKLHDKIFEKQKNLSLGVIKDLAYSTGVAKDAFDQCLNSGEKAELVNRDLAEGNALGVNSTPAFFINGRLLKGAQPIAAFKKIIDEELSQ